MTLNIIELYCITNAKVIRAEVLSCSDKHLKVVFKDTNITCMLHRDHAPKRYVGRVGNLEFSTLTEPERV